MSQRGKLGKEGEQAARDFLISKGYTVRDVNWRMGHLEIDIVAQEPKANRLHIIEVKTRTSTEHFDPMTAINAKMICDTRRCMLMYFISSGQGALRADP